MTKYYRCPERRTVFMGVKLNPGLLRMLRIRARTCGVSLSSLVFDILNTYFMRNPISVGELEEDPE